MFTPFKIANIILHVVIISIFIIVLFFTYGLKLEEVILEHQLHYVFSKVGRIAKAVDPSFSLKDNEQLNKIKITDDPEDIKKIDKHNNELKKISAIVLGIMILITVVAIIFIGKRYNIIDDNGKQLDFKNYLLELGKLNLITLIFVGLTYFGFITFVGYKYIYIDDNLIVRRVVNKMLDKF